MDRSLLGRPLLMSIETLRFIIQHTPYNSLSRVAIMLARMLLVVTTG
jgi:hypothetical protein